MKFSMKQKGKEVGPASTYAEPHNMKGQEVDGNIPFKRYATDHSAQMADIKDPVPNGVSFAICRDVKTDGIKIRGTGAATKGVMARGPMA
jgi:hypothetical protein